MQEVKFSSSEGPVCTPAGRQVCASGEVEMTKRHARGNGVKGQQQRRRQALLAGAVALAWLTPATAGLGATLNWDPGMTATATGGGNGTWDLAATNWFNGASDIAWTDTTGTADIASFGGSAGSITLGANLGA